MFWGGRVRRAVEQVLGSGARSGRVRFGDLDPTVLGVHAPVGQQWVERDVEHRLGVLVGGAGPVVVVRGPALTGKSHLLARTARALLGDHVVVWDPLPTMDGLAPLLETARGVDGPVAVWIDDAPPAVLDALTPATLADLRPGTRVLITVTDERVPAVFADPAVAALLDGDSVTVRLGALSAAETARAEVAAVAAPEGLLGAASPELSRVRAALTPGPDGASAELVLARIVVDFQRLGCPGALRASSLPGLAAQVIRRPHDGERPDIVAAARRIGPRDRPVLRTMRRGDDDVVHADPLAVVVADEAGGAAAWSPTPLLAARLAESRHPGPRRVAGRVALTRGDTALARLLLVDSDPAEFPVDTVVEVAATATWDVAARRRWLSRALAAPDLGAEDVVRVHLLLADLEEQDGHPDAARAHFLAVDTRTEAQTGLARLALAAGDTDEARRWLRRHADDAGSAGPERTRTLRDLAWLEIRTGDPEAARAWFARAAHDDRDGAARRDEARAELGLGRLDRARTVVSSVVDVGSPTDRWWARLLQATLDALADPNAARTAFFELDRRPSAHDLLDAGRDVLAIARGLLVLRHPLALRLLVAEPGIENARFDMLPSAVRHEQEMSKSVARAFYADVIDGRAARHEDVVEIAVGIACARLARLDLLVDRDSVRRCRARMDGSTHPGVRALGQEFTDDFGVAIAHDFWR